MHCVGVRNPKATPETERIKYMRLVEICRQHDERIAAEKREKEKRRK